MNARPSKLLLACALASLLTAGAAATPAQIVVQNGEAPLTNSSIVKLVRAGFREKTVITIIASRPARFELTPERLIELKKSGVSEKIILAMLARDGGGNVGGDDGWDEGFFREGNGAGEKGGAGSSRGSGDGNASEGELGIFGSSGGSRNRSSSTTGRGGGDGETQSNGSASVRILRPATEAGGEPPKLERTPTLTNESIVELVEAGFSEGTIVRRIEQSPVEFDLATPKLAELRRRRVTEPIIAAMKHAMEDDAPATPEK